MGTKIIKFFACLVFLIPLVSFASSKTLYFRGSGNGVPVTGNWTLSETIGPSTEDTTTIHTGNGTNGTFQLLKPGATQGTTAVTTNDTSTPIASGRQFGWFSDVSYTGTFDAGTWQLQHRHDDTRTNITGAPVANIYKCTAQSFSGSCTFLFTISTAQDWWTGSTATASFTTSAQASIAMNGEWLFVQVMCNETANTTTGQTHKFHVDGNVDANASKIVSPNFTSFKLVQAVSQNDNNTAGTTSSKAYTSNVAAGNLLVWTGVWGPRVNSVNSITDSLGNTWQAWSKGKQTNNNSPELSNTETFFAISASSGADTVTVNYSATSNFAIWTIAEFSTTQTGTFSEDQSQVNLPSAATTSPTSTATSALSLADELVVGSMGSLRANNTFTAGTNYSITSSSSANNQAEAQEWKGSNGTGAQTATMTFGTSSTYNGEVITFKVTSGKTCTLILLGAGPC